MLKTKFSSVLRATTGGLRAVWLEHEEGSGGAATCGMTALLPRALG